MQQKTVQLGNYQYLIEHIDGHEGNKISQPFIMIRKFKAINEVIIDTDIFFIEKSIYENLQNELNGKDDITDYNIASKSA